MKNLPIILKSLTLLFTMAVLAIVATLYVASEADNIARQSARLNNNVSHAALDFANAKEEIMRARADILSMVLAPDDAAAYVPAMKGAMSDFDQHMDNAASRLPDYATQIMSLKAQGDTLIGAIYAPVQAAQTKGELSAAHIIMQPEALESFVSYGLSMSSVRNTIIASIDKKFAALGNRTRVFCD